MEIVSTIYSGIQNELMNSVFLGKPKILTIDEEARTTYASNQKIETLIKELKEKGPLVGLGFLGPKVYRAEGMALGTRTGFGWPKQAFINNFNPVREDS